MTLDLIMQKEFRYKFVCFLLEGLASFATSFYFYYIYFLMRHRFGFGDKGNLALASGLGLIYLIIAWQAGRFAQRRGYFAALKLAFVLMILASVLGALMHSASGLVLTTALLTLGQSFLWPTLEALISEDETVATLPRAVGTYNIVWAGTNALACFGGGTLVEKFGFHVIFFVPCVVLLGLFAITFWLERHAADRVATAPAAPVRAPAPDPHRPESAKSRAFQRMAWLANPFAYIAINTLIAVIPGLAARFQLSPMFAGFACSLWCFARFGAFLTLWFWTGWHYRFRWLATAFAVLVTAFVVILTVPSLAVLLAAQIFFGAAIGLVYYSSLFYSMDASDTKGEHGGIHESAIGLGNFVGPGLGAAALQFLPQHPHSGALAVGVLLLCGFGGLLTIWKAAR